MIADKTITCRDCGQQFVFPAREQEFFAERGFGDPVRCLTCRREHKARKMAGQDGPGGPVMDRAPRPERPDRAPAGSGYAERPNRVPSPGGYRERPAPVQFGNDAPRSAPWERRPAPAFETAPSGRAGGRSSGREEAPRRDFDGWGGGYESENAPKKKKRPRERYREVDDELEY